MRRYSGSQWGRSQAGPVWTVSRAVERRRPDGHQPVRHDGLQPCCVMRQPNAYAALSLQVFEGLERIRNIQNSLGDKQVVYGIQGRLSEAIFIL